MRTEEETISYLRGLYATHFGEDVFAHAHCSTGYKSTNSRTKEQQDTGVVFASAPGRVELAGNHTDHQGGCTISGAVSLRASALAVANGTPSINVLMDGFGFASFQLDDLAPHEEEKGTSLALIRGMVAAHVKQGGEINGFNAVSCSDIPAGQGLSSSAAFEVLMGAVISCLFGEASNEPGGEARAESMHESGVEPHKEFGVAAFDLTKLAFDATETERVYFGKPCGAQDQLASAHGGIALLNFEEKIPQVLPLAFDMAASAYALVMIDSKVDHSLYTNEFAAIPKDMQRVAASFNCSRLVELPYEHFLKDLPRVRADLGDRAALRALHFFEENERVKAQARALQAGDFAAFLKGVRLSGASSAQFLQNIFSISSTAEHNQAVMLILALCSHLLDGSGAEGAGQARAAYRITGGGFGGSVIAFIPLEKTDVFRTSVDTLLGYEACSLVEVGARGVYAKRLFL